MILYCSIVYCTVLYRAVLCCAVLKLLFERRVLTYFACPSAESVVASCFSLFVLQMPFICRLRARSTLGQGLQRLLGLHGTIDGL